MTWTLLLWFYINAPYPSPRAASSMITIPDYATQAECEKWGEKFKVGQKDRNYLCVQVGAK
jgi:hypothetical protein